MSAHRRMDRALWGVPETHRHDENHTFLQGNSPQHVTLASRLLDKGRVTACMH